MRGCPTRESLCVLLSDEGIASERSSLAAHVDNCPECQAEVASLADDAETARWRKLLRDSGTGSGENSGGGSLDFLAKMSAVGSASNAACAEHSGILFPGAPSDIGPVGQLGPFAIVRLLGSGATCFVYEAYDSVLARTVALKVLRPEWAMVGYGRGRFQREARAAAAIHHQNVVGVHHVGADEPDFRLPYLVMEFVDGETLAERLRRLGSLPARDAAVLVAQVARGLAQAHARSLVHRDIKPSNILLERHSGRAKLGDFGLAKAISGEHSAGDRFTESGAILGTPAYTSPEQISSPHQPDIRCDIYSLGVVLYETLTGTVPFRGTVRMILEQIVRREPVRPRNFAPDVPRDLETIVLKCLEKDPVKRYLSAEALAADLDRWLEGVPIHARPTSALERGWKWVKRHPSATGLIALTVVATVSFLVAVVVSSAQLRLSATKLAFSVRETETARDGAIRERDRSFTFLQREGIASAARVLSQNRFLEARGQLQLVPKARRGWEWDRLALEVALCPRPTQIVGNHDHGILAGLISRDGRTIVTSGQDGRVIAWDTHTRAATELEHGSWSNSVGAWRHVLTPYHDEPPGALAPDCFQSVCWVDGGERIAGASYKGRGIEWQRDGSSRRTVLAHDRPLCAVACSPDGRRLLWGDDAGTLLFQDRGTCVIRRLLLPERSAILRALPLGPSRWIVGRSDGTISVVDDRSGKVVAGERVRGCVWDADLSPDGKLLAVASDELSLVTFEIDREAKTLVRGPSFAVPADEAPGSRLLRTVRFSCDGSRIGAGDDSGRFLLWMVKDERLQYAGPDQRTTRTMPEWPPLMSRPHSTILFAPDGQTIYTAGRDAAVKRWDWPSRRGITEIRLAAGTFSRFDPAEPKRLWAGSSDGALAVWDTDPQGPRKLLAVATGDSAVIDLDIAARTSDVATCGDGRVLRFWNHTNGAIVQVGPTIRTTFTIQNISLSPDGQRVAAYGEGDAIGLWDARTGRLIRQLPTGPTAGGRGFAGRVRFNCDGTLLAVLAPGPSFEIRSGRDLKLLDTPSVVSGEGGTALDWHPDSPGHVVGGDTIGRVASYPPWGGPLFTSVQRQHAVTGVAYSPRGDRVVAIYRDGFVSVWDPSHLGHILNFRTDHPDPTGVLFDPTGRRLAISHRDGQLLIWESGAPPARRAELSHARWKEVVLCAGDQARDVKLRPPAVDLDAQNRLLLLYTRADGAARLHAHRHVILGRWDGSRYVEEIVRDAGTLSAQALDNLNDSLALTNSVDGVLVLLRRPIQGTKGELLLYRRRISETVPGDSRYVEREPEVLTEPGNWGFDTALRIGSEGTPHVLHYAYGGSYLHRVLRDAGRWKNRCIGRRGDGFHAVAALDTQDAWHSLFRPLRFEGDLSPLTYHYSGKSEHREVLDSTVGVGETSVAVAPSGAPIALYDRPTRDGQREVVIARRRVEGWSKSIAFPWTGGALSNLVCRNEHALLFAYVEQGSRRVTVATGAEGHWSIEDIGEIAASPDREEDEDRAVHLILKLGHDGQPFIVAAKPSERDGWIRVYRADR